MRIISVINQKGGVGKTTTVTNLAYSLTKKKQRVLVLDCDPQGNASATLGKVSQFEQPRTIDMILTNPEATFSSLLANSKYDKLDIVPCNLNASAVSLSVDANDPMRFIGFKTKLGMDKDLHTKYDFILIDCPPQIDSIFLTNALIMSTHFIIPIDAESSYALSGVQGLMKSVDKIRKAINKELSLLGVLLTMYDSRTKAAAFVSSAATSLFGAENLFDTRIHRNTVIGRANIAARCVCDFDEKCPGCSHYRALAGEVIARTARKIEA